VDPVRKFFDEIGDGEWGRFDKDARSRVAFEVHRRFLRRHVPDGSHVLEIGAGPGRFTIQLAQMGCRVVVSDISPVQLEANERRVLNAGWEEAVLERRLVDVRDLSEFSDGTFDAVVAYGGPLSYAFDDAEAALAEMVRVVRPGGRVVASVMELIGTLRMFVRMIPGYAAKGRLEELKAVMATGDNRLDSGGHPCRMFRWSEIEAMARNLPCTIDGASASNFLSSGDPDIIALIEQDPALWQLLLDWEEEYCAELGAVDSATHLLFALQRETAVSSTGLTAVNRTAATTRSGNHDGNAAASDA
jgi:SAM-dependent methyltransferase